MDSVRKYESFLANVRKRTFDISEYNTVHEFWHRLSPTMKDVVRNTPSLVCYKGNDNYDAPPGLQQHMSEYLSRRLSYNYAYFVEQLRAFGNSPQAYYDELVKKFQTEKAETVLFLEGCLQRAQDHYEKIKKFVDQYDNGITPEVDDLSFVDDMIRDHWRVVCDLGLQSYFSGPVNSFDDNARIVLDTSKYEHSGFSAHWVLAEMHRRALHTWKEYVDMHVQEYRKALLPLHPLDSLK